MHRSLDPCSRIGLKFRLCFHFLWRNTQRRLSSGGGSVRALRSVRAYRCGSRPSTLTGSRRLAIRCGRTTVGTNSKRTFRSLFRLTHFAKNLLTYLLRAEACYSLTLTVLRRRPRPELGRCCCPPFPWERPQKWRVPQTRRARAIMGDRRN